VCENDVLGLSCLPTGKDNVSLASSTQTTASRLEKSQFGNSTPVCHSYGDSITSTWSAADSKTICWGLCESVLTSWLNPACM